MPKYTTRQSQETFACNDSNFIFKGGEGSIYGIGDTICKICDAGHMIPEAKFKELAALDHPRIIRPEDILLNSKKKAVGYTMRRVPGNAIPLAQMLTKTYREREGVTPDQMMELVAQIAEGLRFIHSHDGYLQVDGNELNYMVTNKHEDVFFIDVNSFQTPSFPADAIMASIRDYTVQPNAAGVWQWSQLSDWYSFAIISWFMFTAIHPFKGMNPNFPDKKTYMVDQMRANCSVLNPETKYPKGAVYQPFEDYIPGGKDGAYMQWYRATFIDGKRLPAPGSFQATLTFVVKVKEIVGSDNFIMVLLKEFDTPVVGCYTQNKGASHGKLVVATSDHFHLGAKKFPRPDGKVRIGFTPKEEVVCAQLRDGDVTVKNLEYGEVLYQGKARDIMSCDGRIYLQGESSILEMDFLETGKTIVTTKEVASIMPNATQLFQGVAIQNMFGRIVSSVFPEPGHHRQFPLLELDGYRVTEAKYENHVLMVLAVNKKSGEYSRFVLRFSKNWENYDCRVIENVNPAGLNFTVSNKGVCVCLTEEEKVELFSNEMGSSSVKSVDDPSVVGDMHLCHSGDEIRFALGQKLYKFSMK